MGTAHVERWLETLHGYTRLIVSGVEVKKKQSVTCDQALPATSLGVAQGLEKMWKTTDGDGT